MEDSEKRKYAEMFVSMSLDFLRGGITWETFVANTEIAARNMRKEADRPATIRKEDVMIGEPKGVHLKVTKEMVIGWTWAKACSMLDKGEDPREYEVPKLLDDFDQDFKTD